MRLKRPHASDLPTFLLLFARGPMKERDAGRYVIVDDVSRLSPAPPGPGLRQMFDPPFGGTYGTVIDFSDEPRTMTMAGKRYVPAR